MKRSLDRFLQFALLALFAVSLPLLPVVGHDSPQILMERGRNLYEMREFVEAAETLEEAVVILDDRGDEVNRAIALGNLALVYQSLGDWEKAETAIAAALQLLENRTASAVLAQTSDIRGQLQLSRGDPRAAADTWRRTEEIYREIGDERGVIRAQINRSQALQALGLYRQALHTLEQLRESLASQPDSPLKVTALQNLGNALRVVGDLEQSRAVLGEALDLARSLDLPPAAEAEIWLSLGNTAGSLQDVETARAAYQNAADTDRVSVRIRAQLNELRLLLGVEEWAQALRLWESVRSQLAALPDGPTAIEARINLAESLMIFPNAPIVPRDVSLEAAEWLGDAIARARSLGDRRLEAYALGTLGAVYEQNRQWSEAQTLTERGLFLAQTIDAPDIAYRWQWQLGRLLKAQNRRAGAIAAYRTAVSTLESLRTDLVAMNPQVQFSFRDSVEPVYRELVGLILQPDPETGEVGSEDLRAARELMESLQLAELDDFFREACLEAQPRPIDAIDPRAAVFYPIILRDRLEVILSVPGRPLRHYAAPVPQTRVEETVRQLQQSLTPIFSTRQRLSWSGEIYDWLIRPAEGDLAAAEVETLVFVLDGVLRNLPMAALYDGRQYLLERYNIALTPGLQLLEPRSLSRERLKTLAMGLSRARQGFAALPAVETELEKIEAAVPSRVFLNDGFTRRRVQAQMEETPFPVVHLATHGQFSSRAEDTFLLTWDDRINVRDLDRLLRRSQGTSAEPVELLVLSACQTATGDRQAALGLAGVAVRSGARSTIATLWQVNDISTAAFMAEFYRQLAGPGVGKAQALRQAQLSLLREPRYRDPYYWAAFVLIGNWL
ncbi:CHAT domain-containing protein [Lyngbya sp. CCY1209]|uniref:CHAT domain-containing protein n=1 Tax=Lyngbya sp. CCY1209 TaxID=2886103 RepID=UPI002D203223|nr:CHAT domain-containing protein [Lyngbya sp. CCY1209]MEB3885166.1 CHAT domain-containing protein [Lyngbya sp. CCY1209]